MGQHKNAVILARVSSKTQEDEGYSLDSQVKLLRNYCEGKELKVVKEFKIAETASKDQSRKIFHELLAFIAKNDVDHLAVEKTDRLTRNLRDAVAIDDWLQQDKERTLHMVKESLQLHKESKSDVKFMWSIHLAVANKYTNNLREEAMKGWAEKLAQGWLPAVPPVGYVTVPKNGKRIHVPDKNTKHLVRKVFQKYLDPNQSLATITEEMRKMGLVTRKGRPFAKSRVQKMLNNPFYVGVNRFNGRDYQGAQEPIISKALFDAVQQKMHKGKPPVYKKHNPVFKNMMYCEDCDGQITWEKHRGRYYGACQRRSEACLGKKYLREDDAEEFIQKKLETLVCPSERLMKWVTATLRKRNQTDIESREETIAAIRTNIDRIERMDDTLYDDKLAGLISQDKYTDKHDKLIAEKADLKEQLDKLDESRALQFEYDMTLLELSQKAAKIYANKSAEQKRIIMSELFHSITANGNTISVTLTKLAQAIAEKSEETHEKLDDPKDGERPTKNGPDNRGDEGHFDDKNQLCNSWLAIGDDLRALLS